MSTADDARVVRQAALEDLDAAASEYVRLSRAAAAADRDRLRDELICSCMPFASRLARKYAGRGEPAEDLEQVARLGLVNAVDRYDPGRGSFTAFALLTISGEIKRHFRDRTWGVHVPRRLQDLGLEIGHATVVLTNVLTRRPTVAELAAHLGLDEHLVAEAIGSSAGHTPTSLNAPVGGDRGSSATEMGDLLGSADRDLESVDDRLTVSGLLLRLPERERRMLAMRFYGNRTQAEIAVELGISQMHVSRLLSRALSWLRTAMLSDVPPRWDGGEDTHELRITLRAASDVQTMQVYGEIDRDTGESLRRHLRRALTTTGCRRVVVDLGGVALVDAAGVTVLADAFALARTVEVGLELRHAQPFVARILSVSGLRVRPA
jgi:RNA polymerase sigma-B factor